MCRASLSTTQPVLKSSGAALDLAKKSLTYALLKLVFFSVLKMSTSYFIAYQRGVNQSVRGSLSSTNPDLRAL